eukprot:2190311-Rhodomonas_salina.5
MLLPACYAMPGTDEVGMALPGSRVGPDGFATRCPVLTQRIVLYAYALPGTDLAYGATSLRSKRVPSREQVCSRVQPCVCAAKSNTNDRVLSTICTSTPGAGIDFAVCGAPLPEYGGTLTTMAGTLTTTAARAGGGERGDGAEDNGRDQRGATPHVTHM